MQVGDLMNSGFNTKFNIESTDTVKKKHKINSGGKVQSFVDQACINHMSPYTPFVSGMLDKSAELSTVIGSGEIKQIAPQAKYLYYGKLMVSESTGSSYAKYGERKVLTDKDLKYSKAAHSLAGKMWFERMKADKKEEILKGAQSIIDEHN